MQTLNSEAALGRSGGISGWRVGERQRCIQQLFGVPPCPFVLLQSLSHVHELLREYEVGGVGPPDALQRALRQGGMSCAPVRVAQLGLHQYVLWLDRGGPFEGLQRRRGASSVRVGVRQLQLHGGVGAIEVHGALEPVHLSIGRWIELRQPKIVVQARTQFDGVLEGGACRRRIGVPIALPEE